MGTVAILGIAVVMSKVGVDLVNDFSQQRAELQAQQEVQVILEQMAGDIRNAREIYSLSTYDLWLYLPNTRAVTAPRNPYDSDDNPDLFAPTSYTRLIRRQYTVQRINNNTIPVLRIRTLVPGQVAIDKYFLKGSIIWPFDPQGGQALFKHYSPDPQRVNLTPPPGGYDGVEINLRTRVFGKKSYIRSSKIQVMKRGSME